MTNDELSYNEAIKLYRDKLIKTIADLKSWVNAYYKRLDDLELKVEEAEEQKEELELLNNIIFQLEKVENEKRKWESKRGRKN